MCASLFDDLFHLLWSLHLNWLLRSPLLPLGRSEFVRTQRFNSLFSNALDYSNLSDLGNDLLLFLLLFIDSLDLSLDFTDLLLNLTLLGL